MQLGFIVDHLGASQISYLLSLQINSMGTTEHDLCLFIKNYAPPIQEIYTSVFPIGDLPLYNGTIVALDFNGAQYLTNISSNSRKIFYPWFTEWMKHGADFLYYSKIARDPLLEVVVPSKSYAEQFEMHFNRTPDAIIEDCSIPGFIGYCNDQKENKRFVNTRTLI